MQPRRIRQVNFGAGGRVVCAGSKQAATTATVATTTAAARKLRYAKFEIFCVQKGKVRSTLFIINYFFLYSKHICVSVCVYVRA